MDEKCCNKVLKTVIWMFVAYLIVIVGLYLTSIYKADKYISNFADTLNVYSKQYGQNKFDDFEQYGTDRYTDRYSDKLLENFELLKEGKPNKK